MISSIHHKGNFIHDSFGSKMGQNKKRMFLEQNQFSFLLNTIQFPPKGNSNRIKDLRIKRKKPGRLLPLGIIIIIGKVVGYLGNY